MKNAKKEKHHWVPLEQRYAPLFRDGQSVLYRNGDHPSRFDGHFIPANAFFGQLSDGRRFIVVVEGSKVGMVSHTGLSMWDSTFYQSILDFLKKAGIKFTQFGAISNIHHADFTPAIHNSQDLILSNLYSAHTVFHPFTDYILFIADQQDPLTECTKKSFKNFQVSASSMKILKDISLSLFHLEREYMDSYFLENKNTERRLKALNRWYAFLGYKIRFDTEPFQVPIFNATLNDLYLVDTAYLKSAQYPLTRIVLVNGNGSELFSGNFAEASPLKLCGYSVSQSKGFSQQERENLLAEVIHNGIMSKPDVIQYLNWFIKMNGHKTGNSIAKEKWESDLAFVRSLDIKKQTTYTISNVVPYKQRRSKK